MSKGRLPTVASCERSAWRTGASGARAGRLQEQLVRGAPGGLHPSERAPGGQEQEKREQVAYRSSL